jgi:small subunit ribosomal protein S8
MMTDPIADLLTQIRNAASIDRQRVAVPHSRVKESICVVLKQEGFIADFKVTEPEKRATVRRAFKVLTILLKYGPNGEKVLNSLERVSKAGCRVYRGARAVPVVLRGMGISIVSTSKGIMSDRQCREQKLGGEVIARIW